MHFFVFIPIRYSNKKESQDGDYPILTLHTM